MNAKQYSSILTMIVISASLAAIVSVKILSAHADRLPEPLQTQQPVAAANPNVAKWEYHILIYDINPHTPWISAESLQGAINRLAEQEFAVESFQPTAGGNGTDKTYITVLMKRLRK
jgi:hypothetical protein